MDSVSLKKGQESCFLSAMWKNFAHAHRALLGGIPMETRKKESSPEVCLLASLNILDLERVRWRGSRWLPFCEETA